jgi:hypothetical protein
MGASELISIEESDLEEGLDQIEYNSQSESIES